jgi:hypothetical protein
VEHKDCIHGGSEHLDKDGKVIAKAEIRHQKDWNYIASKYIFRRYVHVDDL